MDIKLDIEHVITLANSKSATVGNIFEMVAEDIDAYTKQREDYYLEEIKNQLEQGTITSSTNMADHYADKIYNDVEADIKRFVSAYVEEAIDIILDAKIGNRFKSKKSFGNLLIIFTSMKESYQK